MSHTKFLIRDKNFEIIPNQYYDAAAGEYKVMATGDTTGVNFSEKTLLRDKNNEIVPQQVYDVDAGEFVHATPDGKGGIVAAAPTTPTTTPTTTTAAPTSTVPNKWFVVCVAGQSNAIGYDESPVSDVISKNLNPNRIRQLGLYDNQNLQIVPLGHHADSYENVSGRSNPATPDKKGPKGVHLPLANLLLDEIPEDYGVLMISTAYGGTGFTPTGRTTGVDDYNAEKMKPNTAARPNGQYNWGKDSAYFYGMRDRIKFVLDKNPENIFGGVVWIQGEEDYKDPAGHKTGFTEMTTEFFRFFNEEGEGKYKKQVAKRVWDKDLWYNVETVNYFYEELDADKVWANYREFNMKTYVEIPRDTESNAVNGTSEKTSAMAKGHFGNDSYTKVIAPRIFKKMSENGALIKGAVPCSAVAAASTQPQTVTKVTNPEKSKFRDLTVNDFAWEDGTIQGTFQGGKIAFNADPVAWGTNIDFKGAYKLEFDATQKDYWIAFRGALDGKFNVIRFGNSTNGQIAEVEVGVQGAKTIANIPATEIPKYDLKDGDRVSVTFEENGVLEVKLKKAGESAFSTWGKVDTTKYNAQYTTTNTRILGFMFGSSTSSRIDPYTIRDAMKNVKIQQEKEKTVTETVPGTAATPSSSAVIGSVLYFYSAKGDKYEVDGAVFLKCNGTTVVTKAEYPELFAFFGNNQEQITLGNVATGNGTTAYLCAKN